jgi:hypothetical protein
MFREWKNRPLQPSRGSFTLSRLVSMSITTRLSSVGWRASTCFESSDALNILDRNPVAHPAVNKATNHISRVKFVWESKLNPARFIQRL